MQPSNAEAASPAAGAPQRSDADHGSLTAAFETVRSRTLELVAPLAVEDFGLQPMADASPAKWHLAHTTWFFETFLLAPLAAAWKPVDPQYEYLFNSYYNAVGEQYPRARRGEMTRPTVDQVFAYREAVDTGMSELLAARGDDPELRRRVVLGLHHEEQHQELLLTDLKYAFGTQPTPCVHGAAKAAPRGAAGSLAFTGCDGGLVEIGAASVDVPAERDDFVYDNETPRHRVWLEDFEIADRCVTCGEYLDFIADGGYETPALWLSDGWSWRADGPRAPLYWRVEDGEWFEYRLSGEAPVDRDAPVTHLSFYEADAYARWAGARLPSEAEWERAAAEAFSMRPGQHQEDGVFHPMAVDGDGPRAFHGNQWEWTASSYAPYPRFAPAAGALGEYNGKFMCNQMVLRGGSCVTPRAHARVSYRNFFYPPDRWQFTGVRLARDV